MRRHESPASTSKPPLLDSMYVALPELPLESTLSRKPFLQPSGWDRQWSLSEILARPELPAGVEHGARAEVMILHNELAVLMAEDMLPLPEGKTLQIRVIEDDLPKPGGLFEPKDEEVIVVV
jgi:hypothetical protein